MSPAASGFSTVCRKNGVLFLFYMPMLFSQVENACHTSKMTKAPRFHRGRTRSLI